MAITEGTFDTAELEAALTANPALLDRVHPALAKLGFKAYSDQEFQAEQKKGVDKEIGAKIEAVHSAYDTDIQTLTGKTKLGTEKTYDFLKRAVGEELTARQTKIAELEKTIADGSGDATMKAQLDQLKEKETQYQADIKDRDTKLFQKDVALDIRDGLRELKFDGSVKESLRKLAITNATSNILALATTEKDAAGNEHIRYVRDGKVLLDDKAQPATAAFLLTKELADVLDAGQTGAGGGGTGGAGGGKGGKVNVPDTRPADVKTQGQLMDYLAKLGVPGDTDEFDAAYEKLGGLTLPTR
jgi:hypothetical protein